MALSAAPFFPIGSSVKFEENPYVPGYPRWMWNNVINGYQDYGASGKFIFGTVIAEDPTTITVNVKTIGTSLHQVIWMKRSTPFPCPGFLESVSYVPENNIPAEVKPKAKYSIHHGYFKQWLDEGLFDDCKDLIKG